MTRLKWKLVLSQFGDSANHDSRSGYILDANDGTPGRRGHVESRFSSFGDGVSVGAR